MISLHVEATNKCSLGCPRCARTVLFEKFGKPALRPKDLNIDQFVQFVDVPVDLINFCGNLGDPIYHKDFINLIEQTKKICNRVSITTNGSYKLKSWWKELCNVLDKTDSITFSIDGLPKNFTQYRKNADWQSILVGIKECAISNVSTVWKYIPFSYNEQDIVQAEKLCYELGIDQFQLDPSDRWEKDDWLKPKDPNLNGSRDTVQQEYKNNQNKTFRIDPKCINDKHHYVSAEGYYMPCCYVGDFRFYYKSIWWKQRKNHYISDNKLSTQLKYFSDFYETITIDRPDYCIFNCGKC